MRFFILPLSLLFACNEKEEDTAEAPTDTASSEDTAENTEPATEPSEPATEPASEPAVEPASEPAGEPAAEPATEPASEPATEPASEPAAEDTGDPAEEPMQNCTPSDLIWSVEVRDSNGAGQSFASDASLSLAGVVSNPCDTTLSFSSVSTCLIGSAIVHGNSGSAQASFLYEPTCGMAMTDWDVPPMGSVEEVVPLGTRPVDFYMVDLYFGDTGVHYAYTTFEVVE